MCGGTSTFSASGSTACGLSPRVRGNRKRLVQRGLGTRSIPACAGEPSARIRLPNALTVYPRVCGGTAYADMFEQPSDGLSPRVRGNLEIRVYEIANPGSIPACAGEPGRCCSWRCDGQGLSPRVRGNLAFSFPFDIGKRSIPACAGEPPIADLNIVQRRVYPRVCGGTNLTKIPIFSVNGLSPRVRGNPNHIRSVALHYGSIPACAGEPPTEVYSVSLGRVYPRVCGGTAYPCF